MERECKDAEKFDFKLKSKPRDGVILQLHHTIRRPKGETRRIRFSSGSFDATREHLACSDQAGNLFILDFTELKFWKLVGVGVCTALHFNPNAQDSIAVAAEKSFNIRFIDRETGEIIRRLPGHTAPVKQISFSNSKKPYMLTSSTVEAILWELTSYTVFFTLSAHIQQIMFAPTGDYLVACFQNDTVQIWKHESMKSVKQIIPNEMKHLKSLAFTGNGRVLVMAGLAPTLIIFSMDTWAAMDTLDLTKYNISGAQQIAFIPQVFDGGSNKILAILSSDCLLYLLNIESLTVIHTISPESSGIRKFAVNPTGKYFLCVLQLGEVNIYNTSYVMDVARNASVVQGKKKIPSTPTHICRPEPNRPYKAEVEKKMRICMDSARLRRILMQYGEYPDKYRAIIWRSLLDTPRNRGAYAALVDKGIHPSYKDIDKQFTIHSSITLRNMKRLCSTLSHWCPLFGVMKFLPGFIFPFVKVLQKDPLLLFECVATVLINNCQLWFEYAPFPPISVLAIVENILAEHDQQLLDYFCEVKVTSQTYALKMLETAFSEVLPCSEWLILWDHILSNEPAFILMAVTSYNIIQRNVIRKFQKRDQLENFYQMQNPVDLKAFLKKTYNLLNETPEDIHPRRFFSSFSALEKGDSYQQFEGYPKATICLKLAKDNKRTSNLKSATNKCSLKDLTSQSQEREINQRLNNKELETDDRDVQSDDSDDYDDDSIDEVYQKEHKLIDGHKKKKHFDDHFCNKENTERLRETRSKHNHKQHPSLKIKKSSMTRRDVRKKVSLKLMESDQSD